VRLPLLSATDVKRARQRAGDGRDRREESRPARAR
jgi:hypothetical protein